AGRAGASPLPIKAAPCWPGTRRLRPPRWAGSDSLRPGHGSTSGVTPGVETRRSAAVGAFQAGVARAAGRGGNHLNFGASAAVGIDTGPLDGRSAARAPLPEYPSAATADGNAGAGGSADNGAAASTAAGTVVGAYSRGGISTEAVTP